MKYMQQKVTKQIVMIDEGFNWLACILGGIYYPFKGMPGIGLLFWVIDTVLIFTTFGIGNLIFAIFRGVDFSNQYIGSLKERGYEDYQG